MEGAHNWAENLSPKMHLHERSKIVRTFKVNSGFSTGLASLIFNAGRRRKKKKMGLFLGQVYRLGMLCDFLNVSGPVKKVVGVTSILAGLS